MANRSEPRPIRPDPPGAGAGEARRRIRSGLVRWYRRHRRDLPWRRTRDPYAIWVSEVMLQQTRVEAVVPYYGRFLRRFPDPAALARASEEDVLSAWSGLGYYRRARALRRGAAEVVRRHGGRVPDDPAALRALPGVGRYTAGAIASIGFGLPEPVLDGNVRRVLSRLFAIRGEGAGVERRLWRIAERLVEGPDPGDLNQALMELGALVCVPRSPRCPACPLRRLCRAHARGDPEAYPARRSPRSSERVRVAVALVERSGRILLERPAAGSPFRGSWDVPAVEIADGDDAAVAVRTALAERHGLEVRAGELGARALHRILSRALRLHIHHCRLLRGRIAGQQTVRWMPMDELDETPVSGATRKVLRAVGKGI